MNNNPFSSWNRAYSLKVHHMKLNKISASTITRIDNSEPSTRKFLGSLKRSIHLSSRSKAKEIQRKNLFIMTRLTKIASGRVLNIQKTFNERKNSAPNSLNFCARKQENQRINEANKFMIRKLSHVVGTLSSKNYSYHEMKINKSGVA